MSMHVPWIPIVFFYCHLHLRPVRIFAADQTGEALTRPRGVPKEDAEQIETPQSYAHRIHGAAIYGNIM